MRTRGKFIVVTGPSASGKTSLAQALIEAMPNAARLITVTTRAPRSHERHEVDYHFITREEFERRRELDEFFEHAEVYGNFYGSSKVVLESFLDRFAHVLAVIDVQGAMTLKSKIPDATTLFVYPGSAEDIARRLRGERVGVPEVETLKRIEMAEKELALSTMFDHVIDNHEGNFESTVQKAMNLIGSLK